MERTGLKSHTVTITYGLRLAKMCLQTGPKVIKLFSCSTQLSMKFFLIINNKIAFSYLLAEKFSCSAMLSKKEIGIVSNLRFISMKKFMLS